MKTHRALQHRLAGALAIAVMLLTSGAAGAAGPAGAAGAAGVADVTPAVGAAGAPRAAGAAGAVGAAGVADAAEAGPAGASGASGAAGAAHMTGAADAVAAAPIKLTPVVSGLASPVQVVSAGDGSSRLFVVEQGGTVRIVKNGVLLATPFLDIADKLSIGGERGLLGLAFHPNYKNNGRFYVYFTRRGDGYLAINEYHRSSTNPDLATRAGGRRIITIAHPYANHNGGRMAFGPDGYLYIGTGDGGSAGDPGNRAQSLSSLLGKMLRININGSVGSRQYLIPSSNPYVGRPGLNEIWSRGLRNPWGWSFDKVSGDLWIGDVGQDRYEEIDRSVVSTARTSRGRGVNYGWRVMEGRHCYKPATGCNAAGLKLPVVEYTHSEGCSVTGGYAYRGSAVPALVGRYVFGDFCSGQIWTISRTAGAPASKTLALSTTLNISSFGQDQQGELYVLDLGGALYKVEAP